MKLQPFKIKKFDESEVAPLNLILDTLFKYKPEMIRHTVSASERLLRPFREAETGVIVASSTELSIAFHRNYNEIFSFTVNAVGSGTVFFSDITASGFTVQISSTDTRFYWSVNGSLQ